MEHDISAIDVITKTPAAKGEPVLAITLANPFEFLDVIAAGVVVGVSFENLAGAILRRIEVWVLPGKTPCKTIVVRRASNRKRRGHDLSLIHI